ncbi:MAG TPA: HAMP domain-containing sensor histidine kinase [Ktedonobacteraceae bacterium]
MNNTGSLPQGISLRMKLVLSYLGVTLTAILLMVIVIAIAVPRYFYDSQVKELRQQALDWSQQIALEYKQNSNSWDGFRQSIEMGWPLPRFLVVSDKKLIYSGFDLEKSSSLERTFDQALLQALQGQEATGTLEGLTFAANGGTSGYTITAFYVSEPIKVNDQVVGAVLLMQPNRYPGFSTSDFLENVDLILLITGVGLALAVVVFSLFMARRLTRPLVSLTRAAEEMKGGNYTHRVEEPASLDEIGTLALTFNSMADKIAADVNELREQEQLRRDMTANIAHDLVTPLTAIQGYSEAIADEVISDPGERHETAQLIGREVQRLRRLVSDMQNMTSMEAGRVRLEIEPLNLHDLVTETLAVVSPECEQEEIKLHNAIDPATPLALADSDRLTQVLLNLLDNARRHTPAGGQITLGARADDEHLTTWVSDTGTGINQQDLPYIFERFYRVDRSRASASGGTGLGLAIIKAIIVAHRGSVWAQSVPGKGTTIFFTLPLAAAAPKTTPMLTEYPAPLKS